MKKKMLTFQVNLVDDFFNKKKNRRSHCYRIVYRKGLSYYKKKNEWFIVLIS